MNSLPKTSSALRQIVSKAHPPSPFICIQCRHRAISHLSKTAFSTSTSRKADNDKLPYSEKLRRRIWGTDTPPGQLDPYTQESALERKRRLDREESSVSESASETDTASLASDAKFDYVPATTWDGLEQIGGATGWWEEAWDQEHKFRGFMSPSKLESKPELENAIRRALVEVYTLLEAGRPPTDATQALDDRIIPNISLVGFDTAANDSVSLVFPDEQTRQDILDSTVEAKALVEVLEVQTESETEQSPESTDLASVEATPVEDLTSESDDNDMDNVPGTVQDIQGDDTWKSITFTDAHIKFAILKRTMQLTGKRIPDPLIQELNTAKALLGHLLAKPKPRKLADLLVKEDYGLASLPNVEVVPRRFTPIDKEKEIGRWKVIEKELVRRGLPVTGNGVGNGIGSGTRTGTAG